MIDIKLIECNNDSSTKEAVFEHLSKLVCDNGYAADVATVKQALRAREMEGTTGMMDGFAIPHAKSAAVSKAGIVILKLTNGLEWQSMDGSLITSVIALFIPEDEAETTHLHYLAKIARLLMREEFKEAFNRANTPEAIQNVLNTYLEA